MTDQELLQSFSYCMTHDDPTAWLALALAYWERGYLMNALYCYEKAGELQEAVTA